MVVFAALSPASAQSRGKAPATSPPRTTPDLPVTPLAPSRPGTRLALLITSEAGRTDFESALARQLAAAGDGVLILDARAYFGATKTPARAADELGALVRRYGAVWNRSRLLVVGNSRGADIAPFVANRIPVDLKERLDGVVLIGPAGRASFSLNLRDVVGTRTRPTDLPVMPELERLRGVPLVCSYGRAEHQPFCTRVDSTLAAIVVRDGGHKLGGADAAIIAKLIADRVRADSDSRGAPPPNKP